MAFDRTQVTMPREVICVSIGQAGVQMSSGAWELFCMEHGIRPDGTINKATINQMNSLEAVAMHTFFYESNHNTYIPRAVLVDLEPTVIDEIRSGAYRNLFSPNCLITHNEDAASNYARGHFSIGKSQLHATLDNVRRQIDRCDAFQGFFLMNSSGGGTGSGFTALLLEKLNVEFGKSSKISSNIFPGPTLSNAIVEPYNTCLYMNAIMEHSDITIMLDNEAVYRICNDSLKLSRPTFNCVNRLMAHVVSNVTCSLRFSCSLNADMNQLETNLVPYPRIHFPTVSYAPILARSCASHEISHPRQLIKDVFDPINRLVSCNANEGKYMSCCTIVRGNCSIKHLGDGVNDMKKNNSIQFVDWCPTGFKIGLCHSPPSSVPGCMMADSDVSCMMLANNTSIADLFKMTAHKFQLLFSKRSFVHWFVGEGMEEGELNEAIEGVDAIIADYTELGQPTDDGEREILEPQLELEPTKDMDMQYEAKKSQENEQFDQYIDFNVQDHDSIKFGEDDERMLNEAKQSLMWSEKLEGDANMLSDEMLEVKSIHSNADQKAYDQGYLDNVLDEKPILELEQNEEMDTFGDFNEIQRLGSMQLSGHDKQVAEQHQKDEMQTDEGFVQQQLDNGELAGTASEQQPEQLQQQEEEIEEEGERQKGAEGALQEQQLQEQNEEEQQRSDLNLPGAVDTESQLLTKDNANLQAETDLDNPAAKPEGEESDQEEKAKS